MDATEKAVKGGYLSMPEKKTVGGSEVVISISTEETQKTNIGTKDLKGSPADARSESATAGFLEKSVPISSPPHEIRFSPSPNKPPKLLTAIEATLVPRRFAGSLYSKPKSRFGEQPHIDANMFEAPNNKSISSITKSSAEDEVEEIVKKVESSKEKRRRFKTKVLFHWVVLVCIVGCLVASLTLEKLEKTMIWGLEVWKWCVLVLVIFSGMLVTNWIMHFIVFLIEKNFLLRTKVLYFVHGLKKSVQAFIWLSVVLLTWVLLFNRGVKRSKTATKILDCITRTLVSILIGGFLWLMKTLLLKILACNFHMNRFFERIRVSIFQQYVLQTLSGPRLTEKDGKSPGPGKLNLWTNKKGKEKKEGKEIDMGKFHKIKKEKVSDWNMKVLVDAIMNSGLSTISKTLDESVAHERGETDTEITNEMEATAAANNIFMNVAQPDRKYICREDLEGFMIKAEVDQAIPLIDGLETGQIDKKALTDWVVKVYKDRQALWHALHDTKTAVKQLNKLLTVILVILTFIVWLLLMEIATTKVLVVLSSQFVVAAFIFGNTCKTIFEAIIFVFVMHPFDVGDRCVIDGVQLLVEEMNILTTVFLKLNNEKVYFPNTVLATKPISNYQRSPDMGDTVEFSIDFTTPVERIGFLKEKIKKHLEDNPLHWHPNHNVVVKEIENVNKIKMALYCNHTMNFQDFVEKNKRRSELVIEIKKIFEELNIKYYPLPQQVHLAHIGTESTTAAST